MVVLEPNKLEVLAAAGLVPKRAPLGACVVVLLRNRPPLGVAVVVPPPNRPPLGALVAGGLPNKPVLEALAVDVLPNRPVLGALVAAMLPKRDIVGALVVAVLPNISGAEVLAAGLPKLKGVADGAAAVLPNAGGLDEEGVAPNKPGCACCSDLEVEASNIDFRFSVEATPVLTFKPDNKLLPEEPPPAEPWPKSDILTYALVAAQTDSAGPVAYQNVLTASDGQVTALFSLICGR